MDAHSNGRPRRRLGGLSALLPTMLVLAVLGTAGGGVTDAAATPPVVDMTVTAGH